MLRVDCIDVSYGEVQVLYQVSISVDRNQLVAVVGANGAGKSTLLKTIAGELKVSRGMIEFEGHDITEIATPERVKLGITYVPEGRHVWGPLTVEENLLLGGYSLTSRGKVKERLEFVYEMFPRLLERRRQKAGTLSGGEQQMLAIGRGLMSNPQLLMLDEPSLGLMPKLVSEVLRAVVELKEAAGLTVLLVEQNVRRSLEIADRGYVLETGRIVQEGTGAELLASDNIKKAYLGI
ncbi:MAG: ABC transporter ATP-binding protein [Candidatus Verstraetearchaeota archaeon]|nr:ABC transporter ATP-binding protein [Candidatus Verstraetearchaeota archaeon]